MVALLLIGSSFTVLSSARPFPNRELISFRDPPLSRDLSRSSSWQTTPAPRRKLSLRNALQALRKTPTSSPPVNLLAALTTSTFILQSLSPSFTPSAILSTSQINAGQYYRYITPVFLHGSLPHLGVNMMSLINIGPAFARSFPNSFLPIYLASGIGGNVLTVALARGEQRALGASGAIFGLIGGLYVNVLCNRTPFNQQYTDRVLKGLRQTLSLNLLVGLSNPKINNAGHVGGAITGAAIAWIVEGRRIRNFKIDEVFNRARRRVRGGFQRFYAHGT
jgi:membrane associated rhomboid family serine protease